MLPSLASRPLGLELDARIKCVGFAVEDYGAVISALEAQPFEGVPERAVDKRRAEFLAGRLAAAHALQALGVAGQPGRNADGSPSWPSAVVGSITHGAQRALCAVTLDRHFAALGIDVEALMGPASSVELRRRICSERELRVLSDALPAPEHHLVSLAFSAKESLYKCLFPLVGRFMEFSAAEVVGVVPQPESTGLRGELALRLSTDWSPRFSAGLTLTPRFLIGPGHVETLLLIAAPA